MFSKASESLADRLVKKDIIKPEDLEVYQFGIESFIMKAVHIVSYILIGLIFQLIPELILFLVAFIPLREASGGYHAKTPFRCYLISCITIISALCLIGYVPEYIMQFSIILAVIASLILFIVVPVEAENNPLEDSEISYYKSKAGFIIVMELVAVIIFHMLSWDNISFILALGLGYEMIVAVVGIYAKMLRN